LTLAFAAFGLIFFLHAFNDRPASAKTGGADTYAQHCATCHGADGKADTPRGRRKNAPDLTKSTIGTAQGIRVITNGREEMPAFKKTLSDAEIRDVMAYVRGFRK
jgi:mono/diheme cytochrome c family protein